MPIVLVQLARLTSFGRVPWRGSYHLTYSIGFPCHVEGRYHKPKSRQLYPFLINGSCRSFHIRSWRSRVSVHNLALLCNELSLVYKTLPWLISDQRVRIERSGIIAEELQVLWVNWDRRISSQVREDSSFIWLSQIRKLHGYVWSL